MELGIKWYRINDEKDCVVECNAEEYIKWSQQDEGKIRLIAQEDVGKVWISTVFLGLDHNYTQDGPPIVFETMVFARDEEDKSINYDELEMKRYSTVQEAKDGHELMVELCRDKYVN